MSFKLTLEPSTAKGTKVGNLSETIKQIVDERGSLRNITETSLQEEIQRLENGKDEYSDEEHVFHDPSTNLAELKKSKGELLQLIGQAHNEALTALDFVSLLLSKDAPTQGTATMSPALKSMVHPGTLGYDRTTSVKLSQAQKEKSKDVSIGWNLEALNSAADRLLTSASKLESEMEKEAKYWEEVLSVSEKGWSVCRMPREPHTIAIRYGFLESASLFNARSLAAMRVDSDRTVLLDQRVSAGPKCVRVKFLEDGVVLHESYVEPIQEGTDAPLESIISHARDSLFEEELFYELVREARHLLSYEVQVLVPEQRIRVPLSMSRGSGGMTGQPLREILIDLVSRSITHHIRNSVSSEQNVADDIILAFRILLTHAYRQKFRRRTRPPPPLSEARADPPVHSFIRPLMSHAYHHDAVREVKNWLSEKNLKFEVDKHVVKPNEPSSRPNAVSAAVIKTHLAPAKSTLTITAPSGLNNRLLEIKTDVGPPIYGTKYSLAMTQPKPQREESTHSTRDVERLWYRLATLL